MTSPQTLRSARDGEPTVDPAVCLMNQPMALSRAYSLCCLVFGRTRAAAWFHPDEQHVSCRVCRDGLERRDGVDVNNRTVRQPERVKSSLLSRRADVVEPSERLLVRLCET